MSDSAGVAEIRARQIAPARVRAVGRSVPASVVGTYTAVLASIGAALWLWVRALDSVDLTRVDDYGLVSSLPWTFFAALALLTVTFAATLSRRAALPLLALEVAVLILVIHGTTALLYDAPRYAWVYKHIGVVGFVDQHGTLDRSVDIYQNWPGFFFLGALLDRAVGVASPLSYVNWAQTFFNAADVVVLGFIFRTLFADRRVIWGGIWLFLLGNWIGEDYFAPQALAFLLTLIIVAICLYWLAPLAADEVDNPGERRLAVVAVLLVSATLSVTHQLSPGMAIAAVTVLVILGRCRPWWLPLAMGALFVAWTTLFAGRYLLDHTYLFGPFGKPKPQSQLLSGHIDTARLTVAWVSRALVGALALTAFAGWLRLGWRDVRGRTLAGLAVAPLPAMVATSYGGEILFRVYLFMLPWLAVLAAAAFFHRKDRRRPQPTAVLFTLVASALTAALLVAYYGQERIAHIGTDDVAAAEFFYGTAPPGSYLMQFASNSPTRLAADYPDYEDGNVLVDHRYWNRPFTAADVPRLADALRWQTSLTAQRTKVASSFGYLAVTASEISYADYSGRSTPADAQTLVAVLRRSPAFVVAFERGGAVVFRLRDAVAATYATPNGGSS